MSIMGLAIKSPAPVAQSAIECLTQADPDIFHRVVLVHVQIAARDQIEIERAVPRDLLEHVIEKADAGINARCSAAVEIQFQLDAGFVRGAVNRCSSHRIASNSRSTRRVCESVPQVMRT